ncbi:MAG: oligopeptide transport system ATP-binding protein [Solirubrobacteraceae bacterium]
MKTQKSIMTVARLHVRAGSGRAKNSGLPLVEDVNYALSAGEVLGVVGETGAGKTMTIRGTLGLLPRGVVADGEVTLGDEHITLGPSNPMRRFLGRATGIVVQNPHDMLDPLMRTRKQMIEGVLRLRTMSANEASDRAEYLLGELGFRDPERVLDLYPSQLSGGMAQRVAIAMALMPRPAVVAVDEPTSALDAQSRIEVLDLIRDLCAAEGTAVIFVSHDLELVGRLCDAVAVMYAGRVIEQGTTDVILRQPSHPYTKALLRCAPSLSSPPRQPLPLIAGSPPRPGTWPAGCTFAPRCPHVSERAECERPVLRVVDGRAVACHRAEELAATTL